MVLQDDSLGKNIKPLQKMFNDVPGRYDLMNRLMTLRLDELWRKKAARLCLKDEPSQVADICTGTGDLASHLAKFKSPSTSLTALDFSEPMLQFAGEKFRKKGLQDIRLLYADVAELPFPDRTFDAIGIGFAFRNLTYNNFKRELYLSEIFRVLKTGGRFVIVETSQPPNRIIRFLFHLYLRIMVRGLGGILSGNKGAYRYLAHSAIHYYKPEEVSDLLLNTGFSKVTFYPQFLGIASIHLAIR
jgi:demethylmenaquinone methyltransferase/2-methoxy-6-polyprenyl-1,4-benzoquinol methylase